MTPEERQERHRESNRRWRRTTNDALGRQPRPPRDLTLDPILVVIAPDVEGMEGQLRTAAENRVLGIDRQRRKYWRDHGLTAYDADRLAVRLGTHPALIWPEWWTTCEPEAVDA